MGDTAAVALGVGDAVAARVAVAVGATAAVRAAVAVAVAVALAVAVAVAVGVGVGDTVAVGVAETALPLAAGGAEPPTVGANVVAAVNGVDGDVQPDTAAEPRTAMAPKPIAVSNARGVRTLLRYPAGHS